MIPANFWKRVIISFDSTIGCLVVVDVPAGFEALPITLSLIAFLGAFKLSEIVSNTSFAYFTLAALSKAPKTLTFCDSVKFLFLKILFV